MLNRPTSHFAYPAIALLWIVSAGTASPQDADGVVLRADSRAVQLSVVVENTNGKPVGGLGKENFAITDDGKPREIKIFEEVHGLFGVALPAAPAPIDGVYSNRRNLSPPPPGSTIIAVDTAAGALMGAMEIRPQAVKVCEADDYVVCEVSGRTHAPDFAKPVAVYAICPQLRLLQDFTSERAPVLIALQSFASSSKSGDPKPSEERCPAAQVLSTLRDIAGYMSASASRSSLLWLTSGFNDDIREPESGAALNSALAAFNDADAAVYAAVVSCAGTRPSCGGSAPTVNSYTYSQSIQDFVHGTGGGGLYIASATPAGGSAPGAMLDLAQSGFPYRLGFYIADSDLDGRFHPIRISLPGKPRLVVNGRRGYTASPEPVFEGHEGKVLASQTETSALGMTASVRYVPESNLDIGLSVDLGIFPHSGNNAASLDETLREFDHNGTELTKFEEPPFRVSPGAAAGFDERRIGLANGAEWLTILVRLNGSDRVGSLTTPLRQARKQDQ